MTTQIKKWLCDQFVGIDSVRTAKMSDEDTIAIHTWSGVVIQVCVVETLIKARTVKRIVSENTRVGIGTLFIVNGEYVPEHGDQVVPDEGLLALHALFNDKLYTYYRNDGELHIGQVHFKAFNRGEQREIWHGPDVPIKHLPCYKVWVSTPQSIKGNWLIANFASEAFWKHADYIASRDVSRQRKKRAEGSPRRFEWTNNPVWSTDGASQFTTPIARAPETELDRSYRQLGLARGATSEDVKTAFRKLAREVHPDVSQLPKAEAEARFSTLYQAYTVIKSANGW